MRLGKCWLLVISTEQHFRLLSALIVQWLARWRMVQLHLWQTRFESRLGIFRQLPTFHTFLSLSILLSAKSMKKAKNKIKWLPHLNMSSGKCWLNKISALSDKNWRIFRLLMITTEQYLN